MFPPGAETWIRLIALLWLTDPSFLITDGKDHRGRGRRKLGLKTDRSLRALIRTVNPSRSERQDRTTLPPETDVSFYHPSKSSRCPPGNLLPHPAAISTTLDPDPIPLSFQPSSCIFLSHSELRFDLHTLLSMPACDQTERSGINTCCGAVLVSHA